MSIDGGQTQQGKRQRTWLWCARGARVTVRSATTRADPGHFDVIDVYAFF